MAGVGVFYAVPSLSLRLFFAMNQILNHLAFVFSVDCGLVDASSCSTELSILGCLALGDDLGASHSLRGVLASGSISFSFPPRDLMILFIMNRFPPVLNPRDLRACDTLSELAF